MSVSIAPQFTARIEGDFVVFLIGMRINRPWEPWLWVPVLRAMPRMIRELERAGPDSGFLGHSGLSLHLIAQYWRSFDHLERYARATDSSHWPEWVAFNHRMKGHRGDVGIWHETYLVNAGDYEAVYSGMPPFGLSKAAELVPIGRDKVGQTGARDRLAGAVVN
jgi:hypothetical protein